MACGQNNLGFDGPDGTMEHIHMHLRIFNQVEDHKAAESGGETVGAKPSSPAPQVMCVSLPQVEWSFDRAAEGT